MTNEQLEALKAAAKAATPQDIDMAESVERHEGGYIECPVCGGDGNVTIEADYCNYDNTAIGVQFYGIGPEHGAAERYFRAASPANVIALIERLERAEAALATPAPLSDEPAALTDSQIEAGWRQTFSTNNPYCPCNLNSFTKAVRWAERAKERK
jgi:hypothetical protein